MTQSSAPDRLAFSTRPSSSPAPCPTSAAKQSTRAPYVSRSQGTIAEVSSPPEYARTTNGPMVALPVELCNKVHKHTWRSGPVSTPSMKGKDL